MGKSLLDRGDAAGIAAFDDVFDLSGEDQVFFGHDFTVFDHIDCDVVVQKGQNIQIEHIDITFYFQNIFFSHFIAAGIFDDGHGAVQLV